jgi:oligopeptide transport system substrate-binding protein
LKKIVSLLIIIVVCSYTSACSEKDGSGYIFKYDIADNPRTLDPQTATGQTAALLISNLYDGLLKVDRDGRIVAGVAAEYMVSDDGLTYTFLLREDVYWHFGGDYSVQCTALDFVFAFRRLFNPAVKSENAPLFYSIRNAERVHREQIPYLDAVGVEAVSDFELIITLEHPNPLFPYLLTTSPAMPCNEELFNKTAGRYGLNAGSIPSNGAFYITRWNFDPFSNNDNIIIMRRHEKNSEAERVYPYGLNFFIGEREPLTHFTNATTHSLIAEGEDAMLLMSQGFPYDGFENAVWGIAFNTRRVFANTDLRYALAAGFDREALGINRTGWREALEIIPPLISLGNQPYRILAGETEAALPPVFNPGEARESFERGINAAGRERVSGLRIIIPAGENHTAYEALSRILQQWQLNLGFFCRIETLTEDEFTRAFTSGEYDLAMMKLTGDYNSPDAYLNRFRHTTAYRELLSGARQAADTEASAKLFVKAESILIEQAVFVPVCFQTEKFFYNRRSRDLIYNPFTGTICFREAKYF